MKQSFFNLIIAVLAFMVYVNVDAKMSLGPFSYPAYVEGPTTSMEEEAGFTYNGMVFYCHDYANREVTLCTHLIYDDDEPGVGGQYVGELNVPSFMINDDTNEQYTVTGVSALYRNGVTVLRLPETITSCNTIYKCRLLREVYLNDNLREFSGILDCPRLVSCPLPSALEYIGSNSMSGTGLKEIKFPPRLSSIGDKSFCRNYDLERLDLGNLEIIGDSCFNVLPTLNEITLPETLRTIGKNCFRYCYGVETINLPSHEIDIDVFSFMECNSIKTVTVLAEVPYHMPFFLIPDNQIYEDIILYVPEGSVGKYEKADGWKNFKILPISEKNSVSEMKEIQPKGWKVYASKGGMTVWSDSNRNIGVVDIGGRIVATVSKQGNTTLSLPQGVYTVLCEGYSTKTFVK